MKIKKRLKYKSTLPKADFGMDASNMNKAAAEQAGGSKGIGVGGALDIANAGLGFLTSFAPKDNDDGLGVSHKGSAISKGISGGLHAGASMAKAVPGIGTIVGGVMDAAATVTDFITGLVDNHKENDRSQTSRLAKKEYNPMVTNTGYSFGNSVAKYGMPLYGNGGRPTTQDSLLLYKNQLLKDKFYKNNPDYRINNNRGTTNNKELKSLEIQTADKNNSARTYVKQRSNADLFGHFNSLPGNREELINRFRKVSDNVYSAGDILQGEVDGIFNPNSPPSYFSSKILPQKWNKYSSSKFGDSSDVPMYDPIAVKPVSMLTPAERKEREKKYPNSFGKASSTAPNNVTKKQEVEPIYVTDPNDPRLKSYQDSSRYYSNMKNYDFDGFEPFGKTLSLEDVKREVKKYNPDFYMAEGASGRLQYGNLDKDNANWSEQVEPNKYKKGKHTVEPIGWRRQKNYGDTTGIVQGFNNSPVKTGAYDYLPVYKKPVQPVIYKKPEVSVPKPKFNVTIPQEEKQSMQELLGKVLYANEPTSQHEKPVESRTFNNMFTQEVKTMNGKKIYKRKDTKSPWIEQYKNGGEPNIDSTLNANKNLEWVNRLYDQNPQSIQVQGQKYPSTHLLTQADNFVYPEVVKGPDGKLEHLSGEEAYHFAMKNKTAIPFKSEKDALWFTNHYKEGTGVLKGFALGGFINKNKINNSLSNGMFSPNGKFFSSPEQYQQYQSLYNPQFQLQQPIMNNYGTLKMKSDFKNNSFFELGGDPRAQSNIEAEGEEAMLHSNNQVENIEGPSHEEINTKLGGKGVPIKVQPSHEYIFSNSLGRDKNGNITLNEKDVVKSFADDAKSIQRRYSKREGDSIVDKTKELELAFLKQDAEQARVAKEQIEMGKQMKKYKAKYGADLKKFGNSGYTQYGVIPSGKQPSEEDNALTIQKRMLAIDPNALPKYGADGNWGTESQTAFDKLSPQMEGTPQFNFNPNSTPATLFGGGINPNPFIGPKPFNPSRRDALHEAANFYTPGQVGISKSRAQKQGRQNDITPETTKKGSFFGDLTTGDKMQLASMLPAFGFNMGMGLRKADVEPNRKNQYENEVLNMMANRKFDPQHYLNQANLAANTAKEDIGNNSTSVGGKIANLQKLYANQLGTLGDITTKGQEMNNQYRAEEANTKNILGEANRAESIRAAGINDQNKARKQQFLAKAFEQMGQGLATTGQSANQSLTNKLLIKSLSEISPDFDVKNMKDLQVGDDGYIVFKGVKTEFKMSDEGKIVMVSGTPTTANAAKSQYAPKLPPILGNFIKTQTKTTK